MILGRRCAAARPAVTERRPAAVIRTKSLRSIGIRGCQCNSSSMALRQSPSANQSDELFEITDQISQYLSTNQTYEMFDTRDTRPEWRGGCYRYSSPQTKWR